MSVLQASLFGDGEPDIDPGFDGLERIDLAHGAWVELRSGWMGGEQTLFDRLVHATAWHAGRRPMYDRIVDVPRLTAGLPADGPVPPVLESIASALSDRYGEPFDRIGLAWYRDGNDSVAPHGDRVARDLDTAVMATVSCGERRRFLLTPAMSSEGGGRSVHFDLGRGDLLVMGGTIQRTYRHAVPKTTRPVGPRLCIMFRPPWIDRMTRMT